jgi:diacylglycerol kinase (ATP)
MRVLAIVNPAAGGGRALAVWKRVAPPWVTETVLTEGPGHATHLARTASAAGFDRLLAVGGDGTLHEVVNGVGPAGLPVGLVPAGSGNDFARSAALPLDPRAVVRGLAQGATRSVDLGRVHGRFYLNVAGVGFDAQVAAEVNAGRRGSRGALLYVGAALRVLRRYRNLPLEIRVDGRAVSGRCLLVAVANGAAYGGGMRVCPRADVSDGQLDVCLAGDLSRTATALVLPSVFLGLHLLHPAVRYLRGRQVEVRGPEEALVHADGELVGALPATFAVVPGALSLWVPAPAGRG